MATNYSVVSYVESAARFVAKQKVAASTEEATVLI
jgi:hypothetical protein